MVETDVRAGVRGGTEPPRPRDPSTLPAPPLVPGLPVVGVLPRLAREPLEFMESLDRVGPLVRARFGPMTLYFVNHPDLAGEVQVARVDEFVKAGPHKERLRPLLGDSLPVADGDPWRRRRRLMNPMFSLKRLSGLSGLMTDTIAARLDSWTELVESDRSLDLSRELATLAMQVLATSMFSRSLSDEERDQLGQDFRFVTAYVNLRIWTPGLPEWVPMPREHSGEAALDRIEQVIRRVVADRRRDPGGDDLLALLLEARDDDGAPLSDVELRDELMALLFGGHETTATTVTWTFAMLEQHPEIEARVRREIDDVLGDRTPGMEDWPKLKYTKAAWEEAMRMFPPAFTNGRTAAHDCELGGYFVPAGAMVMLNVYGTHHHPDFWEHPHRFNPDRMLGERAAERHKWAHYPFGLGPRHCIGANMGNMEALYLIAMIMQRFRLSLEPGADIRPTARMSIQPRRGLPMRLHPHE
jgi:cytochrome P450